METHIPLVYTLEGEEVQRINNILKALDQLDIQYPNDIQKNQIRFRLLKRLFICSAIYIKEATDREKGNKAIDLLLVELNKSKAQGNSSFIELADSLEMELRNIIHDKLQVRH